MKLKIALPATALFISLLACQASDMPGYTVRGGTNTPTSTQVAGQSLLAGTPAPKIAQTPTLSPTPIVDYQEMYNNALTAGAEQKATADSANVVIVGWTAEQDARLSAEEIARQEADEAESNAIIISINATSSYAPTALHLTGTAQAIASTDTAKDVESTELAPEIMADYAKALEDKTEAETYAEYADQIMIITLVWQFALAIFAIAGCLYCFVRLVFFVNSMKSKNTLQESPPALVDLNAADNAKKDIPLKPVDGNENERKRFNPQIPCTEAQLLELAHGIRKGNKTLAWRHWAGSDVYSCLEKMRPWMLDNEFAKKLTGGKGELDMLKEGERFLDDCIAYESPPPQYECVP